MDWDYLFQEMQSLSDIQRHSLLARLFGKYESRGNEEFYQNVKRIIERLEFEQKELEKLMKR